MDWAQLQLDVIWVHLGAGSRELQPTDYLIFPHISGVAVFMKETNN